MFRSLVLKPTLFFALAIAASCHAAPPPVEAYAALPEASLVRLSPDGLHLAYASDYKGHEAIVIADLQGHGKPKVLSIAPFDLDNLQWKDSDQLVASLRNFYRDRAIPLAATRL